MSTTKKITLRVPPDQTPEEEAQLVAEVAAAMLASGQGVDEIDIELTSPEETDFQAVSSRTHASSRWNA